MNFWLALAYLLCIAAVLVGFGIGPSAIEALQNEQKKKPSLRRQATPKATGKIKHYLADIGSALRLTGQAATSYTLFFVSFVLILVGIISGVSLGNPFLVPILATALAAVPFLYVRVQYRDYKALLLEELNTSISVITSSYLRTDNVIQSFEENLPQIGEPLQGIFRRFVFSVTQTGIPIAAGIEDMKKEVGQSSFTSWCESLKRCLDNRTMKYSLSPFVDDISDILQKKEQAKAVLHDSKSEFVTLLILSGVFMAIKYWLLPSVMGAVPAVVTNILIALDLLLMAFFSLRVYFMVTDIQLDD